MLQQNRYKRNDFIQTPEEIKFHQVELDIEIEISKKHDIFIVLESHQLDNIHNLQDFLMNIVNEVPRFDNETQDYFEQKLNSKGQTTFNADLSIIYIEGNNIRLDYWSTDVNNQFDIIFTYANQEWILKKWNRIDVPPNWRKQVILL